MHMAGLQRESLYAAFIVSAIVNLTSSVLSREQIVLTNKVRNALFLCPEFSLYTKSCGGSEKGLSSD